MKINFKTGALVGTLLALSMVLYGHFYVKQLMEKAEHSSEFDLSQLSYEDLDGNAVSLEKYHGKTMLVNFWATWCAPCIGEFPLLNDTYQNLNEDYVFVMVSYEAHDEIKEFLKDHPYEFVFLKSNNFLLEGITTVPQSFVLNKEGKTVHYQPTIFEGTVEDLTQELSRYIE